MAVRWTTADVPDQSGRTALVTGANGGLGYITSRELAGKGAHVVLACRDRGRGADALGRLRSEVPDAAVELLPLDLADLSSVRVAADAFADRHQGLDVLVNNAGVMALPYRTTVDGFETQFGVNYLGHFALTALLLPQLLRRPEARVVSVSSQMHRMGRIDFGDLQGKRRYRKWAAYSNSKLANLLFAHELGRRAEEAATSLRSVAAHPGYAATNLQLAGLHMGGDRIAESLMRLGNRFFAQSDEMGALPFLYAATMPGLAGGSYVGPGGLSRLRGYPKLVDSSAAAKDEDIARRLWDVSAELTGVDYHFTGVAG
ncbi:MAG: SDR family NAD(P)-dependent oxidoreductase [Streptosporangiales bacterium]|nr:SDR family NAD(P)-dependent oxidoreductase [Streptosporangiales bacterium]